MGDRVILHCDLDNFFCLGGVYLQTRTARCADGSLRQ